ncbi:cyclophilin-like fold protein [Thermodesulfatator atlanticus]|uniref:cyclophilin-like fold protein n=1 Tax=Thermodesulfatator atlanticus TaxID=501497 RepID=UPI0003B6634C|nr:cyclophilin-like fold protein [Thermodesulfatator atlanticus]
MKLKLDFGNIVAEIELNGTACARAIWEAAPFSSLVHLWGEEIYFETPVTHSLDETAKDLVEKGDVGYWPDGKALCLFFGPTPISSPGEIRPASAVNIVGRVITSLEDLYHVPEGAEVTVEKA